MLPHRVERSGNPFLGILRSALERKGVTVGPVALPWQRLPAALHVHWLEAPFWGRFASRLPLIAEVRVAKVVRLARRLRARGRPVVWTAHNLAPHDYSKPWHGPLYAGFRREFLPLVSDVICMSETVLKSVHQEFPELAEARFHLVRHPHYVSHFATFKSEIPAELKTRLPKTVPVISTFGLIRPYKNIPVTIRMLRSATFEFRFVVAGKGPDSEMALIREAIGSDHRFVFIERRASDEEIIGLTGASDIVLMNFKNTLNSGSVIASLSLGRPVLAPNFGAITDLSRDVGPGWVQTFSGGLNLAEVESALRQIRRRVCHEDRKHLSRQSFSG